MAVHIPRQQVPVPIAFFEDLRVVAVGVHEVIDDDRAIERFADAVAVGVVGVFDDDGCAVFGGFGANQMILGIVPVADGFFGARLFDEIAVVVIAIGDVILLDQTVVGVVLIRRREPVVGFGQAVADNGDREDGRKTVISIISEPHS